MSVIQEEPTTTYMKYLFDIASGMSERPFQSSELPVLETPATFLLEFLQSVGSIIPITRRGMELALDILFSHPSLRLLLQDEHSSVALQQYFAISYLPKANPVFTSYWTYIILPAWNQHIEIQRALAVSEAEASKQV